MPKSLENAYSRDEDLKPGSPPRPAQEPEGSENSTQNSKTMTDPATGAPQKGAPEPNQSKTDETPQD